MEKLNGKFIKNLEIVFLISWEILLIIRMISVYSLLPYNLDTLLFTIISFFGIILLLKNLIQWVKHERSINLYLFLFLCASLMSTFINGPSNILGNFKILIWQSLYCLVVFEIGKENRKKVFSIFSSILKVSWFILIFISIIMFFLKFSFVAPLEKLYYGLRIGFVENRLFGVFVEPNLAATVSFVVVLLSLSTIKKNETTISRIFPIVNIIFQIIFISLSGSRTVLIEIIACTFIGCFFLTIKRSKQMTSIMKGICTSLILTATFLFGLSVIQKACITIANQYEVPSITSSFDKKKLNDNKVDKAVSLDRKDVEDNSDISNSRFKLWGSAYEIFKDTPIFGTSPRGLVPYAQKNLPHTWIAHKGQTPHNMFFYSLASIGLLGTIPLFLFLLLSIFRTLKNLWNAIEINYSQYLTDALIVLAVLISGLLAPDLIFIINSDHYSFGCSGVQ